MIEVLELVALLLVAAAWALSLAHAAEYPGKMRLGREEYFAAQTIYYPGFTIGGASEPLSILSLVALLTLTATHSTSFWLVLLALAATILTQAVFWLGTQPVNRVWTKDLELSGAGAKFFRTGGNAEENDWTALRDRWERSHLWRAALMTVALVSLGVALTISAG